MPPKNFYDYIAGSRLRTIIFLFAISFIIRSAFVIPVIIFDVPLMHDEIIFFDRAVGYEKILSELFHGQRPSGSNLLRAYEYGAQPPFHAFLLGAGFFLFGKHIAVARFLMAAISAMTTPLVYLLTSRVSTQKAAVLAALLHIFYPSFIAYSHYLLSETTYIFLLLLAIYFTVLLFDAQIHRKRILYAILSGFFLGLCGLTRAAVLPFLFIVPLWLVLSLKGKNLKLILPGIVVVSYLIVLSPWQTTLIVREKNPGILSNITGWYLHIGNNPWIPKGYGSSWLHDSRAKMLKTAREYKKIHSISTDQAQRELALQEIKRDFKAFLVRAVYKLRMFWSMEFFVLIHLFQTAYPPMHSAFVVLIWSAVLTSYVTLLLLAIHGFLFPGAQFLKKRLFLSLVIAGMAPALIVFGIPRFHLPLLALLLPFAGFGVANLKQKIPFSRRMVTTVITLLLCFSVFSSLPLIVSAYFRPSTYYCRIIKQADDLLGSNTTCLDVVVFRVNNTYPSNRLNITALSNDYLLHPNQPDPWMHVPKTQQYNWEVTSANKILLLDIYSHNTSVPLDMLISSESVETSVTIRPIRKLAWRQWQPSGLNGVEYMWLGGGWSARQRLPDDELFRFK